MKLCLAISLCLNMVLAAVVVWAAHHRTGRTAACLNPDPEPTAPEPKSIPRPSTLDPLSLAPAPAPFHWSQVESEDYRSYAANLRALGCPEATVRDILSADVQDLFYRRVKQLVDEVQPRFWELMTNPDELEKVVSEKETQLEALTKERREVLEQLLGSSDTRPDLASQCADLERVETGRQFYDFLPAEKIERCLALEERFKELQQQPSTSGQNVPQNEFQPKLKGLQDQQAFELEQLLSPDELAEYKLRSSPAADPHLRLAGLDLSEYEIKELVRIQERCPTGSQAEAVKALLGESRFGQYQRAQDRRYAEFYEVADRLQLPAQTALAAYEMRAAAEEQARQLRADETISTGERTEKLKALRLEAQDLLTDILGSQASGIYQTRSGQWLGQLEAAKQ